jgi:hypothetical protein
VVDCESSHSVHVRTHLIRPAAFQIFHTTQGNQGILGAASKQQLENVFGSAKDIDAMSELLKLGVLSTGKCVA